MKNLLPFILCMSLSLSIYLQGFSQNHLEELQTQAKKLESRSAYARASAAYQQLAMLHYEEGAYEEAVQQLLQSCTMLTKVREVESSLARLDTVARWIDLHLEDKSGPKFQVNLSRANANLLAMSFEEMEHYLMVAEKQLERKEHIPAKNIASFHLLKSQYQYYHHGNNELAIAFLKEGIAQLEQHKGERPEAIVSMQKWMAINYMELKDIERARFHFEKAVTEATRIYGEDHYDLASVILSVGNFHLELEEFPEALSYFQKAVDIWIQIPYYMGVIYTYNNMANVYSSMGELDKALDQYQHCRSIWKEAGYDSTGADFGLILFNLGNTYRKIGNYKEALKIQYRVLAIDEAHRGSSSPEVAQDYRMIANTLSFMGRFDESLEAFEKAFQVICPEFQASDPLANPAIEQATSYREFSKILEQKAEVLSRYGNSKDPSESLLWASQHTYQRLSDLTDHLRSQFGLEGSRMFWQKEMKPVYENAINNSLSLYKITQNPTVLDQAFALFEKSKALVLAESILSDKSLERLNLPQKVISEENRLRKSAMLSEQRYRAEKAKELPGNDDLIDSLLAEQITSKAAYISFLDHMKTAYPDYYDAAYSINTLNIAEVQQSLSEHSALLSYFWGEDNIYVFSIAKDTVALTSIPSSQLSSERLQSFLSAIYSSRSSHLDFEKTSYTLFQHLISRPLKGFDHTENLFIIPSGLLGYLPIELLLTKEVLSSHTQELPYLIKQYKCSYSYSATLLFKNSGLTKSNRLSYAGFAPSYQQKQFEDSVGINEFLAFRNTPIELQGITKEVKKAHKRFGGKAFVKEAATESKFKKLKQFPAILHLAMHALVDDQNPMQSKLLFTKEKEQKEDGYLNAYEIYGMHISSQLAILSACNTGYGAIKDGEGIMSLSRAFMYAGCPSIVMSLWKAKDQPTEKIMDVFLEELEKGIPKDEALRNAKLTYLNQADPVQAHPSNWATFVLIGDTSPVHLSKTRPLWWIIIPIILLAMFLIYKRKGFKKAPIA